jgi:hypothetical protein
MKPTKRSLKQARGLCGYFDWDEDSEQVYEIAKLIDDARSRLQPPASEDEIEALAIEKFPPIACVTRGVLGAFDGNASYRDAFKAGYKAGRGGA